MHQGFNPAPTAPTPTFRVELPRASDAIGSALRGAYDAEPRLPDEMTELLRALDGARAAA